MKTKLTRRWHSAAPTLPNLDLQHNNMEDQVKYNKLDIKSHLNHAQINCVDFCLHTSI